MKIKSPDFFQQIRDYLVIYLPEQRISSPCTVKSYREVINLYLNYLCITKNITFYALDFKYISTDSLNGFLEWLSVERKCNDSTLNHHLAVIRAFLKYVGARNLVYSDYYVKAQQVPFRKTNRKLLVDHFDDEALEALLAQPESKSKKGHRDLFFMILLYDTGARDSEILNLHPCDIRIDSKTPYVYIRGKGKKLRTVPIMPKTAEHFSSYIKRFKINAADETPLFFTTIHGQRQRMSDDNVARFLKKYAASARKTCNSVPEKVTPHMFRHSRALSLYKNGVPLSLISEWLGHSDLETTMIYAYADIEMKRKSIDKATAASHPMYVKETLDNCELDEDEIRRYYGLK